MGMFTGTEKKTARLHRIAQIELNRLLVPVALGWFLGYCLQVSCSVVRGVEWKSWLCQQDTKGFGGKKEPAVELSSE